MVKYHVIGPCGLSWGLSCVEVRRASRYFSERSFLPITPIRSRLESPSKGTYSFHQHNSLLARTPLSHDNESARLTNHVHVYTYQCHWAEPQTNTCSKYSLQCYVIISTAFLTAPFQVKVCSKLPWATNYASSLKPTSPFRAQA